MRHPTDRLAEYAAGTLAARDAAAVEAHLSRCAVCRQDAESWQRVAEGVRVGVSPAPASVFVAVRSRLGTRYVSGRTTTPAYRAVPGEYPVARAIGLLTRQWRLVGWPVWGVSAAVLVAGTALAAWVPASAQSVLAVVVPLVAALAIASACGGGEPPDELIRATPTSVRTILLARLTLVLGAIFGAAVAGTLVLSLAGAGGPDRLLAAWIGPMSLLSAVSFAFSVAWRPAAGLSAALALWALRVLVASGSLDGALSGMVEAVWRTSWPVLAVAVALVAGGVVLVPHLPSPHSPQFGS